MDEIDSKIKGLEWTIRENYKYKTTEARALDQDYIDKLKELAELYKKRDRPQTLDEFGVETTDKERAEVVEGVLKKLEECKIKYFYDYFIKGF